MREDGIGRKWTEQEVALLTEFYPLTPMAKLVLKVGKTAGQIKNKVANLKLRRDQSFLDATRFKPGSLGPATHNWIEPGERRDTGKYISLKLPSGEWVLDHRWTWEQANGPIPDDCVIVARDGNIKNTALANLQLVSKDEHCRRNRVRKYPAELQDVILAQQDLKRAIREKS
ncbi:HNH endonuclease signature motif containing protein [Pseudomonas sp. 11/12A]|uniref:HNH endonuclease signature motif containing protein n=1 Tax=Pseudomonas sp. 11/12A TaxID=1506582 RepID=UPI00068D2F09|nr:HNH endonuclease signature motif containing protein [Pseudomonas sp. 11/12A]